MAYSPPEFRFAGMSIGGENIIECSECGALLKEGNAFLHTHWHERLRNMKVTH